MGAGITETAHGICNPILICARPASEPEKTVWKQGQSDRNQKSKRGLTRLTNPPPLRTIPNAAEANLSAAANRGDYHKIGEDPRTLPTDRLEPEWSPSESGDSAFRTSPSNP